MIYTLVALYGLCFGSFFNVIGLRVPIGQSIVHPRSTCPLCDSQLTLLELIPVFSYLYQKGRCRHCQGRISPLYPTIELLTAGSFVLLYATVGFQIETLPAWILVSLLIIVTISDLTFTLIPNKILFIFFLIFIVIRLIIPLHPWWDSLLGASVSFSILYLVAVISNGGMGGGDIKLFTLIGFVVGLKVFLLAFLLATFIGSFFGVIGMVFRKLNRKSEIPFAPAIAIGTILALFYYESIINYYVSLF